MPHRLIPHPTTPKSATSAITVAVARPDATTLQLSYRLRADLEALAIPPAADPERADELWRHTCFEAFLRAPGDPAYLELNLSPSGRWAVYRFTATREGMAPADLPAPEIMVRAGAGGLTLDARIHDLPSGPWRLALSAVIEARDGRLSYWALTHPGPKPDFHHADAFVLDMS